MPDTSKLFSLTTIRQVAMKTYSMYKSHETKQLHSLIIQAHATARICTPSTHRQIHLMREIVNVHAAAVST
jgi:hypothetical protein